MIPVEVICCCQQQDAEGEMHTVSLLVRNVPTRIIHFVSDWMFTMVDENYEKLGALKERIRPQ